MNHKKLLRLCHLAGTGWFAFSASCLFLLILTKNNNSNRAFFLQSKYSFMLVSMLVILYLLAIFMSFSRSQQSREEHPLTTDPYYTLFYSMSPFIGGLAGICATIGMSKTDNSLFMMSAGTVWMTFVVWVIIDPVTGLLEMLTRTSRQNRKKRLEKAKKDRETTILAKQNLIREAETNSKIEKSQWEELMQPYAEKLASLMMEYHCNQPMSDTIKQNVVDIGVCSYQIGGINCMCQLYSMTMEICKKKHTNPDVFELISIWWDGIGGWRSGWFEGENKSPLEINTML